jgi:hypothetical protein
MAAQERPKRHDAGRFRLTQRDIDGLLLCAEHYGAQYDLLAEALRVDLRLMRQITYRWRRSGYVTTEIIGPGAPWCWLTRAGMATTGLGFPASRPALSRLAHSRATLAARLWLADGRVWTDGQAWWHSERRLRAGVRPGRKGHIPDAEIHWPSLEHSPYADQIWAVEIELTSKTIERTAGIITEMLATGRYATVVYLTAPAARSAVQRAVASLPRADQVQVAIRDLPANAFVSTERAR